VPSCLHVLRPALLSRTPGPDANYRRRDRTARSQQPTDHDDPAKPRHSTATDTPPHAGRGRSCARDHGRHRCVGARNLRGRTRAIGTSDEPRTSASRLHSAPTKPSRAGRSGCHPGRDVLLPAAATPGTLTPSSRARAWRRSAYPRLAASCAGAIRDVFAREPCDRQPARGSPASSRTSLIYRTRFSPISERCGALRLRICAAWMPPGRCCSRRGWRAAPPLRA
jgi:hypothetical protein